MRAGDGLIGDSLPVQRSAVRLITRPRRGETGTEQCRMAPAAGMCRWGCSRCAQFEEMAVREETVDEYSRADVSSGSKSAGQRLLRVRLR